MTKRHKAVAGLPRREDIISERIRGLFSVLRYHPCVLLLFKSELDMTKIFVLQRVLAFIPGTPLMC